MATLATSLITGSSAFLQVSRTCIYNCMCSDFGQFPLLTTELSALERLKNQHFILVATQAPSCLIESSSLLQVAMTTIKSRISSEFGQF